MLDTTINIFYAEKQYTEFIRQSSYNMALRENARYQRSKYQLLEKRNYQITLQLNVDV